MNYVNRHHLMLEIMNITVKLHATLTALSMRLHASLKLHASRLMAARITSVDSTVRIGVLGERAAHASSENAAAACRKPKQECNCHASSDRCRHSVSTHQKHIREAWPKETRRIARCKGTAARENRNRTQTGMYCYDTAVTTAMLLAQGFLVAGCWRAPAILRTSQAKTSEGVHVGG